MINSASCFAGIFLEIFVKDFIIGADVMSDVEKFIVTDDCDAFNVLFDGKDVFSHICIEHSVAGSVVESAKEFNVLSLTEIGVCV